MTIREKLSVGNRQYLETSDAALRLDTAENGQHPYAIVVCCSDSRVIPEQSIEYAAGHLHCQHIIVLGHTGCGAVTAALEGGGDGFIKYITDDILEAIGSERDPDKACCLNVEHAVDRLKREFASHPEVGEAVIEGAVYDIKTGVVRWL